MEQLINECSLSHVSMGALHVACLSYIKTGRFSLFSPAGHSLQPAPQYDVRTSKQMELTACLVMWDRECDEEEAAMQGGQQALNLEAGRSSGQGASSGLGRHSYFRSRKLQRTVL